MFIVVSYFIGCGWVSECLRLAVDRSLCLGLLDSPGCVSHGFICRGAGRVDGRCHSRFRFASALVPFLLCVFCRFEVLWRFWVSHQRPSDSHSIWGCWVGARQRPVAYLLLLNFSSLLGLFRYVVEYGFRREIEDCHHHPLCLPPLGHLWSHSARWVLV